MSDFDRFLHAPPKEAGEGGEVARLLAEAGPRPKMSEDDFRQIKRAARAEWRAKTGTRTASSRRPVLALAATLVLALAAVLLWRAQVQAPEPALSVVRVDGSVRTAEGEALRPGGRVIVGATIDTGQDGSRLALRLADGESLRLDAATRLRYVSEGRFELERGAVYFDSAGAADSRGVRIETSFGAVRDVGTQFEVRIDATTQGRLRVRVREGAVALDHGGVSHSALEGEELRLEADGDVVVAQVAAYGNSWDWVVAAAPALDIAGVSLARYLDWVARETGWRVRFADPELEVLAASVRLQGTIEDLTVDQSLDLVLPGSGLSYRLEEGVLVVESTQR